MGKNVINDSELLQLLNHFSIEAKPYTFRPSTGGYINDTFFIFDKDVAVYVLQRINTEIFEDVITLMGNIEIALFHLTAADYQTIKLIPTRNENTFAKDLKGNYWRLWSFIPYSATFYPTTDPKIAYEAGKLLANFHQQMATIPVGKIKTHIPKFQDLSQRWQQFKKAWQQANSQRLKQAKDTIAFANTHITTFDFLVHTAFPFRTCHNDPKLNNMLFHQKTKKGLCLIDLDTLMQGHFYYDFGDTVRTVVNPISEEDQEGSSVNFSLPLFRKFLDGLISQGPFLSKTEIHSLTLGTAYMPFLHGLRALTDYLENDRYYKVSHDNQNLDRSKNLFAFAGKALEKSSTISTIIQDKLC